ncbi:PA2169 family four-helix-bundle protein [Flavobacteriaceae bacterium TP-CH-4]|uniref:PA2169 family four-helix-bundle protein n=1 Tax=Pelagihabitans pacificus TaxID=2696054 RepID=A0A967AQW9_9FLAO|nr:PA2169 family four-helix-bundle protein [Pelagihabitans pacificus]NHF58539.1 PA2169 family four-helix-bundle protein [Pelagihabitans pacificus]
MKYSEKVSNKLNELLEKTYDAEKGYRLAQDKVDNPSIKKFFGERVQQRYNFGHELKTEISSFGQLPEKGGSVKGSIHRTWMNLTSSLSSNEEERMLEEVARGEKKTVEEYNEILNNDEFVLPESTRQLLTRQRDAIQASIEVAKKYEELVS